MLTLAAGERLGELVIVNGKAVRILLNIYKALKTKLKLNTQHKTLMAQHAGYSRWVYKWGLAI
ncbi:MAG: helix-turn-helix domain-containing protein [Moorea sp. SIO2I5]|nr:helix-turn-helix domain-containing protein [Moorena sp. SIO2I5]